MGTNERCAKEGILPTMTLCKSLNHREGSYAYNEVYPMLKSETDAVKKKGIRRFEETRAKNQDHSTEKMPLVCRLTEVRSVEDDGA